MSTSFQEQQSKLTRSCWTCFSRGWSRSTSEQVEHNKHSIRQGKKDAVDLAAANYLEFLKEGRKAILEDAVILQDKYPKHRIFNLPCFKLPQNDSTWGSTEAEKRIVQSFQHILCLTQIGTDNDQLLPQLLKLNTKRRNCSNGNGAKIHFMCTTRLHLTQQDIPVSSILQFLVTSSPADLCTITFPFKVWKSALRVRLSFCCNSVIQSSSLRPF
ncbi:TPA: hypothetical protein ACH3X2_004780 [Trebouxia sp. C0005]